ncbi:MAG TPA: thiamine-phosphate kinase [Gemmatimonadaceae bacterium]|nr:thiamine-phosphate kinase [Gemmatimonadaceae bacterium]
MSDTIPLGPGREFDLIRDLIRRWGTAARGIGDDAAVLDVPVGTRLVASTDATVENVHFRPGWLEPPEIGYRAATAALSDLAAMAARPIAMLVAMAIPPRWREQVGAIAEGIGEASRAYSAPITGGNLTGGGELALTVTVLGYSAHPVGRTGARVGDSVYVTGTLGGPRCALRAWESAEMPRADYRARFARPSARIREALWLASHGATAAIDVSDGLLSDVRHLAAASGVDACIELDAVPAMRGVSSLEALASGEEYELVVTAPTPLDEHAFARQFGVPLTRVGVILETESVPGLVRVRARGAFVDLPQGHDHFSA